MLQKLTLSLVLFFCLFAPALAQEATARLAFVQNNALYVLEPGSKTPVLVDDTPSLIYYAVWSPDGDKLAYITTDNFDSAAIHVWDGTQSIELITGVELSSEKPLAWAYDGGILYMSPPSDPDQLSYYHTVYKIPAIPGYDPERFFGQVEMTSGVGGPGDSDTALPMQFALNRDNSIYGKPYLDLTPYGLVYSAGVIGGGALLVFNAEHPDGFYDDTLVDVTLSPDQQTIAGISDYGDGGVVTTRLDTLEDTPITTQEKPRQLAWDGNGNLYYGFQTQVGNLLEDLAPEQAMDYVYYGMAIEMEEGPMIAENRVGISRIAPDGTETPVLEDFEAYGIGRMQVVGSTLYFSAVNNGSEWIEATSENVPDLVIDFERNATYFHTSLYKIDLATPDAEPVLVLEDAAEFAATGQ